MISKLTDYNYPKPINTPMKLRDILQIHEDDGGGATAGTTASADIAQVSYPLFVRGRTRKEKRKNARAAVGQSNTAGPAGVGQGIYEFAVDTSNGGDDDEYDLLVKLVKMWWTGNEREHAKAAQTLASMGIDIDEDDPDIILRRGTQFLTFPMDDIQKDVAEAHTLNSDSVIYRLDKDKPMSDTEVLVLGGAGRYTLAGLRDKARKEARQLSDDLASDHGGSFRGAAHNIRQLSNTLNTIVAAYNELKRIRAKGGRGSRGITDEDKNFVRECLTTLENYTKIVNRAVEIGINVTGRVNEAMKNGKMDPTQSSSIKGMFHLNTDPGYGFYRWAIHVAGNHGGDKVVLGPNGGPFAYAYTDEEEKMIRDAVKAITGKQPVELTGGKSEEPDFVNKKSTMPTIDWKKVK
jgi:hypothetical protein